MTREEKEKLFDILASMQGGMLETNRKIDSIGNELVKVKVGIETEIIPKQEAAAEGISAILEQLVPTSRVDELENRVKLLEAVLSGVTSELQRLKKAQ